MGTKIIVPNMGESIVDATIARWFTEPGDRVEIGQVLVELETDKVNLEVGAEQAGIISRIDKQAGEDVRVGEVLGEIETKPQVESTEVPSSIKEESAEGIKESDPEIAGEVTPITPEIEENGQPDEKVTPIARRVAQEHGIDLSLVQGTGARGTVVRQDVEKFMEGTKPDSPPSEREKWASQIKSTEGIDQQLHTVDRHEERVRMSRRRRTIAQRLVEAQQTTAMLTTFNDVDMKAVMDIRQRRKIQFKDKHGVNLGIVSFFIKASIIALQDFPRINAEIQGDEIVMKHYYDIGVAVGAEEGLVVPVLRDADKMSFAEIEKAIMGFVQRSQEGTLTLDDLKGGTFTITNGGVFGSLLSTPILNTPQVGILGLHRIDDRPVAKDGEVVIRPMMYLALSYDHRIVDGREAVQFLRRIKEVIEDPEILLLEG
jgi:2-oxoglutarate dehydrogenase E2 component (dihydrolipoamide succinyltransferase)